MKGTRIPIKTRFRWVKHPIKLLHLMVDGKKLLVVMKFNWRGVEWVKRYEVVDELDENRNPIGCEFKDPKPAPLSNT